MPISRFEATKKDKRRPESQSKKSIDYTPPRTWSCPPSREGYTLYNNLALALHETKFGPVWDDVTESVNAIGAKSHKDVEEKKCRVVLAKASEMATLTEYR